MPSASKPTAVMLLPEAPYPPIGGGALRSASLVEHFARHYTLDAIHFRLAGEPDPATRYPSGYLRRSHAIDLPLHSKRFLPRLVRNLARAAAATLPLVDRFSGYEESISHFLGGHHYQVAILEHFWTVGYAKVFAPHTERLVLDLHNLESEYFATQGPLVSPVQRPLVAHFERTALALEHLHLPRFNTVLTTSAANASRCREVAGIEAHVVPNTIPLQPLPQEERTHSIVFSGNFAYQPNQDALVWFRSHVWPQLRKADPTLRLRLVGKEAERAVPLFPVADSIDFVGPVDDAVREIARSKVAIVPVLSGSGTRLKMVEAWAAGTPVVATPFGAAGLEGNPDQHYISASTPDAFTHSVLHLVHNEEACRPLRLAARLLYELHYTWNSASLQLKRLGL